MTSTITTTLSASDRSVARRHIFVALLAAVIVAIGEAFAGFMLASPGQGEWDPALVVAAIAFGAIVLVLSLLFLGWLKAPRAAASFAVSLAVLSVPVAWLTSMYGLSFRMALDNGATAQARTLLATPQTTTPQTMCAQVTSGDVGPISAPYQRCVSVDINLPLVLYQQDDGTGLIYEPQVSTPVAPDLCARHLSGSWWAFGRPFPACPAGYRYVPGG